MSSLLLVGTLQLVLAPALKQQRENQPAAAAASNGTTTDSSHTEHPLPRVAFAFDSGAKSFRQTLYPAYKV
jgi:5'-3' exonuclease